MFDAAHAVVHYPPLITTSAFGSDPPRSSPEAEPRLLKKTQLKENIASYLQDVVRLESMLDRFRMLGGLTVPVRCNA